MAKKIFFFFLKKNVLRGKKKTYKLIKKIHILKTKKKIDFQPKQNKKNKYLFIKNNN